MRLTCNKKAFLEFKDECEKCSEYQSCYVEGKHCFVQFAEIPISEPLTNKDYVTTINMGEYGNKTILKSDVEKSIIKNIEESLRKQYLNNRS